MSKGALVAFGVTVLAVIVGVLLAIRAQGTSIGKKVTGTEPKAAA